MSNRTRREVRFVLWFTEEMAAAMRANAAREGRTIRATFIKAAHDYLLHTPEASYIDPMNTRNKSKELATGRQYVEEIEERDDE